MTAKTLAEWREIDDTLARDGMGWLQVGDCWVDPNDPLMAMETAESAQAFAEETGCPQNPQYIWQPHANREQAMMVLDAIQAKIQKTHGSYATATLTVRPPPARCRMKIINVSGPRVVTLRKAICLAAIAWLNAQKGD